MRVSKTGFDARTTGIENCLIHESMVPEASMLTGIVSLPAGSRSSSIKVNPSSVTINLGKTYTFMPKIILVASGGYLPNGFTYYCFLNAATGVLTIENKLTIALQVRYAIYEARVPDSTG
jgi:hypothetical protein